MTVTPCRCHDETVLVGPAADDYTESHLVRETVDEGAHEVVYRCPATRREWVMDIADDADAPALRLRRLMTTREIVEFLATEPPIEDTLAVVHPEIEFRPVGETGIYRGFEEAERWATRFATAPDAPKLSAISLIEHGDDVVVLGTATERRGGSYVEHKPAAWLVRGERGRVIRNLWFDSWDAAREAAGLPKEGGPDPQRLPRSGFLWLLRRPLRARLA